MSLDAKRSEHDDIFMPELTNILNDKKLLFTLFKFYAIPFDSIGITDIDIESCNAQSDYNEFIDLWNKSICYIITTPDIKYPESHKSIKMDANTCDIIIKNEINIAPGKNEEDIKKLNDKYNEDIKKLKPDEVVKVKRQKGRCYYRLEFNVIFDVLFDNKIKKHVLNLTVRFDWKHNNNNNDEYDIRIDPRGYVEKLIFSYQHLNKLKINIDYWHLAQYEYKRYIKQQQEIEEARLIAENNAQIDKIRERRRITPEQRKESCTDNTCFNCKRRAKNRYNANNRYNNKFSYILEDLFDDDMLTITLLSFYTEIMNVTNIKMNVSPCEFSRLQKVTRYYDTTVDGIQINNNICQMQIIMYTTVVFILSVTFSLNVRSSVNDWKKYIEDNKSKFIRNILLSHQITNNINLEVDLNDILII